MDAGGWFRLALWAGWLFFAFLLYLLLRAQGVV